MTTKPTEEERIQVLESLRGAMQAVTEKLQSVETNLTYTAGQLETQSALWKAATERYERLISEANGSVRSIEKQLDEFKKETDRFKQYSSGIDENLKERFQIFAEKFDNQGKSLGLLETSISRIRELDLDRINDKVKELPSL
jgi:chromosome segregation ATPase